ncbi:hypothetical protein DFH09DRAFT_561727 [Mycena vulgaris]|nr:hypothetical protein DFH09DRAFT_561727 [Mycena vulgaris]
MDVRLSEETIPAAHRYSLTMEDLGAREALAFQKLICDGLWEVGGLTGPKSMDDVATDSWQALKSTMRLTIYFAYQKILGGSAPVEVTDRLLAAIGKPDVCLRGHLFAILRLLVHHKNEESMTPICTEYISKKSFVQGGGGANHIEELTMSQSDPIMADRPMKRRRSSETAPAAIHITVPTEKQLLAFSSAMDAVSIDASQYALSASWHRLPFPLVYLSLPNYSFKLQSVLDEGGSHLYNTFDWMEREAFPLLVKAVANLTSRTDGTNPSAAFLLGTIGVGKSHLLAALAVHLRQQGKVVVYVPDCGELVKSPVHYMGAALLCAFSGQNSENRIKRVQIRALTSMLEIESWCKNQYTLGVCLIFLVDQLNGLENREFGMVTNIQRERARGFLLSLYCNHICVRTSDQEGYQLLGRGQNELVLTLRRTLTPTEITSWFHHFSGQIPTFSPDELDWYHEYVGGVFLYYPLLLNYPNTTFSEVWPKIHEHPVLATTRRSIQQFATRIRIKDDKSAYENYMAGARAFITGTSTKAIRQDLIDHRYCFVDDDRGRVISGLVRRELFALLEQHDRYISLSIDWLDDGLTNAIDSPPVVAFMVKKSTLASLLQGVVGPDLVNWGTVERHTLLTGQALPRDLPWALKESGKIKSFLIIPEAFSLEDIDGLYVQVDNAAKRVLLVPIQITLAGWHKDSATRFYNRWRQWIAYFDGYVLETAFLWVVEELKPIVTLPTVHSFPQTRAAEVIPDLTYQQHCIHLKDIASQVWDSLLSARKRYQMRAEAEP